MAVTYNVVELLLWAKNLGASFERTLTLGHQGLSCSPRQLHRAIHDFGFAITQEQINQCFHHPPLTAVYADEFLRFLGAKEIVSVDRSDFEGATRLHDLNEPFPESDQASFSFVLDGGTLEHIFNYPAALRHCLELVRPGGHFLTTAPVNNHMGHGFYQPSPELFFRVFSEENGFALRKIVLYETHKANNAFFQVNDPALTGMRSELVSAKCLDIGVLARRATLVPILASPPQQSDYVVCWERHQEAVASSAPAKPGVVWRIRKALNPYWPYWLRGWKRTYAYYRRYGAPKLNNRRYFYRLPRKEMFSERAE
jgi:SAM-dependent methyltransferase